MPSRTAESRNTIDDSVWDIGLTSFVLLLLSDSQMMIQSGSDLECDRSLCIARWRLITSSTMMVELLDLI